MPLALAYSLATSVFPAQLLAFIVNFARLHVISYPFHDNHHWLGSFSHVTSLKKLPHLSGRQWSMLLQWLPVVLQSGYRIMTRKHTKVSLIVVIQHHWSQMGLVLPRLPLYYLDCVRLLESIVVLGRCVDHHSYFSTVLATCCLFLVCGTMETPPRL